MQREQHEVPAGKEMVESSPLGKPEILARLLVRALRRDRRRLIYPRAVAVGYTFPGLFRIYGRLLRRRLTDKIDLDDRRVLLGGSFGDPEARRRREAWERERRDPESNRGHRDFQGRGAGQSARRRAGRCARLPD